MIQVKGKVDPKGIEEKLIELLRNTKMDPRVHNTKLHQIMSCTDERVISSYPLPVGVQAVCHYPCPVQERL